MTKPIKNFGKSVKTKLLNLMNSSGYKYMYLLARYFNERLLYRVSMIARQMIMTFMGFFRGFIYVLDEDMLVCLATLQS